MSTRKYLDEVKATLRRVTPTAEQDELFKQVGRLVIALSQVEENLAVAYLSLCFPDADNAEKKFFRLRFDERLDAISKELQKDASWGVDIEAWREFKGLLKRQKTIRNLVSHQAPNSVGTALSPTWPLSNSKGRPLTIQEIREAADEVEALDAMLGRLHVLLGASDGILGGWEPE